MLQLKLNNGANTYTFGHMPSVVINCSTRVKEDTTDLIEEIITWNISGALIVTEGDIQSQVNALEAFLGNKELATALIIDNTTGTTLESVPTDRGIHVEQFNFSKGDGPEWATLRTFEIILSGESFVSSVFSSGELTYTITYGTEQSGLTTRTISGTLKDVVGKDVETKYTAIKVANDWTVWLDSTLISDSYSVNDVYTNLTFTIVHKKYWQALPASVTNGSVSTELSLDNQNVMHKVISGWFEGTTIACNNAVNALRTSDVLITENASRNEYENRTSFSLEYIVKSNLDIVYSYETVTVHPSYLDFVHKRILGYMPPIKQLTSYTPCMATQSGIVKSLMRLPTIPMPHWSIAYVKGRNYSYSTGEYRTAAGSFMFTLTYSYEFESNINLVY